MSRSSTFGKVDTKAVLDLLSHSTAVKLNPINSAFHQLLDTVNFEVPYRKKAVEPASPPSVKQIVRRSLQH